MIKKILVTGGAGFIGTNLIKELIKDKNNEITSLDNYFTGDFDNHQPGVEYILGKTIEADILLAGRTFDVVYHFGEYSRIVTSFDDIAYVTETILGGTPMILELCRAWGAKLIYSASSSKFGNKGADENLSPYAWMKAKMVELIKNYHEWFGLEYQICYFFNVYGPGQIMSGEYATVVGIFERQWRNNEKCTVVFPGTQSRDFTHIQDIIDGVILASQKDYSHEWYLRSGVNITIIDVAEMFGEWTFIPERRGERVTSEEFVSDTNEKLGWEPKHNLIDWVKNIKRSYYN